MMQPRYGRSRIWTSSLSINLSFRPCPYVCSGLLDMTMPIVNWQELDHEKSPPMATEEILHLIPTFHAECDTKCLVILPHAVFDEMMLHLEGDCTMERIGILTGRPYKKSSSGQ